MTYLEIIGERLSRMPYNPEVAKRIREERENERIADYVNELDKSGGKKKPIRKLSGNRKRNLSGNRKKRNLSGNLRRNLKEKNKYYII